MFRHTKTMVIPGDYQVVFEGCVLALRQAGVRVLSANPASGVISGRKGGLVSLPTRMDVAVQPSAGLCTVTASSELRGFAASDWGTSARNVSRFFDMLVARAAPLAGNPQAMQAMGSPGAPLPSSQVSSAPLRRSIIERQGCQMTWGVTLTFLLILVLAFVAIFISYASMHPQP